MGNRGIYHWDDDKSNYLKDTRGFSIGEIVDVVFYSGLPYLLKESPRYPNQYRVIAKAKNMIVTIAMEEIEDEYGELIRVVTYWEADDKDKRLYKKELGNA